MNIGTWLWNHILNKWDKAPSVVTPKRMAATGQVVAGAHKLYWMALNPSAGLSLVELSDDITGLTAVVFDHFDTSREGHMLILSPPMPFVTGIWLKTFTNMTSVIFGYV